jgi:hypothetical protein
MLKTLILYSSGYYIIYIIIKLLEIYLKEDKPFKNLGKGKKVKVKELKGSCKVNNKE